MQEYADPRPPGVAADRRQCGHCRAWVKVSVATGWLYRHKRAVPGRRLKSFCPNVEPLRPAPRNPVQGP